MGFATDYFLVNLILFYSSHNVQNSNNCVLLFFVYVALVLEVFISVEVR